MEDTPFPEWLRPPYEGFSVDDLFRLKDLPPHTQLIDGSLIPRARQSCFHTRLRKSCPDRWVVAREMVVVIDRRQVLEPDVSVIHREARRGPDSDPFPG
ncbi:hypothetical protein [Streptomyces gobiensis]|uniref:hypothetical protein n=1 Tax=Streptomyces gobiensis TaxID=2875706 RepID=UPI0030CF21F0